MDNMLSTHPMAGSKTGQYFESDDGKVKVPVILFTPESFQAVKSDLSSYQWNPSDFLLATFPKNGTHFMWEVMTMLIQGSAENVTQPKEVLMIDLSPVGKSDTIIPSPRVLNTHYRIDVLPAEFRKAKTVVVVRNPKDACVSMYHHEKTLSSKVMGPFAAWADLKFDDFAPEYMHSKDMPYGSYFDYTEYMWSLRDEPNILLVFYEDLKMKPVETIQKVNEFMGTNRSPELVQQIAEATDITTMRKAKVEAPPSEAMMEMRKALKLESIAKDKSSASVSHMYRKGKIGDWKNHFTVARNEEFDAVLAAWEGGKDIPFTY